MNIIVLMAGDGQRFANSKYRLPKPYNVVNGKMILEWTLNSLPFIAEKNYTSLTFAIRSEHIRDIDYVSILREKYGVETGIVVFPALTRGNLETAVKTLESTDIDLSEPIMILDADNLYDGSSVLADIQMLSGDAAHCCYFNRLDESLKWGFAIERGGRIIDVIEKEQRALDMGGYPMVGVFYYSSRRLFETVAREIIEKQDYDKHEFFMTQTLRRLINMGVPVTGTKVKNVIPLGIPEDVEYFEKDPFLWKPSSLLILPIPTPSNESSTG